MMKLNDKQKYITLSWAISAALLAFLAASFALSKASTISWYALLAFNAKSASWRVGTNNLKYRNKINVGLEKQLIKNKIIIIKIHNNRQNYNQ